MLFGGMLGAIIVLSQRIKVRPVKPIMYRAYNILSLVMEEFILQTAILSGDGSKELRIFAVVDISVQQEVMLTQRLCGLMNKYQQHWDG